MPAVGPPAPFLCALLYAAVALQRSDPRLAYVTPGGVFYYSCSQDPQPCTVSSLSDCRCKDVHHPQPHPPPASGTRPLTVWFTSPLNAARLLNNSEVTHLTLVRCGAGGPGTTSSSSPGGHFAVRHLERLTVVDVDKTPVPHCPAEANGAWDARSNSGADRDNGVRPDASKYKKDKGANPDSAAKKESVTLSSLQCQDIFLGRELGATRLGIIHSSVLEWGAEVKAYTVQTRIDDRGALPFPDLHLAKLPETSVIYVSFVY
ncbi:uncharacterized protein ACO6RY_17185 [Pungitius sinensis]